MASILKVDEITGKTSSSAMTLTPSDITVTGEGTATMRLSQGLMKIWCQWDMDSGVGIADSFNTSSITDSSSTKNRVFFTNNFSQADGSCFTAGGNNNGAGKDSVSTSYNVVYAPRTGEITYQSYSNADPAYTCVQGMGDLA